MKNSPLVSVIVPTRNSAKFLESCLKSIKNQSYEPDPANGGVSGRVRWQGCSSAASVGLHPRGKPRGIQAIPNKNIELIVVDNNSIDKTKKIAKKFADKIFNKGPERSAQRNFGVKRSSGDYVLIIDSDMILSKKVIRNCVEKIQADENIKGIIIPEESFGEGFWAQCKKLERSFYIGIDWMESARFFRKSTFQKVGGYDERLVSGEDWDLSQKIKKLGAIGRIDNFIYHNEGKINLAKTIKKKFYYAGEFKNYVSKNKDSKQLKKQAGIFSRYKIFFSQPKKLFKNPILGVGMLFMKTCEFGFGGMGYIFKKAKK